LAREQHVDIEVALASKIEKGIDVDDVIAQRKQAFWEFGESL